MQILPRQNSRAGPEVSSRTSPGLTHQNMSNATIIVTKLFLAV